jgi:hypothetical protein
MLRNSHTSIARSESFLGQREIIEAEDARQRGDHAPGLVPE